MQRIDSYGLWEYHYDEFQPVYCPLSSSRRVTRYNSEIGLSYKNSQNAFDQSSRNDIRITPSLAWAVALTKELLSRQVSRP